MLGEQFYEHKGRITSQRVLEIVETGPKIETSFFADGNAKGTDVTDIGTYWAIPRSGEEGGVLYGEGQGVIMTKGGQHEMASWTGHGIGRFSQGGRVIFRGSIIYKTNSTGKLSFLNNLVAVFEFDVDEAGNTTSKEWEWK
jgi:hypothetical protein